MPLFRSVLLAAGSLSFVLGAPTSYNLSTRIGTLNARDDSATSGKGGKDVYRMYTGSGTEFPDMTRWVSSFDDMFTDNYDIMKGSCKQFGVALNSDQEISDIKSGINQVASATQVDARFILAILLQESNGCVRAPTSNYGVRNPGLMQDHNGAATCNDAGVIQNPCPSSTITQMIRDGAAGTSNGDGLLQTLAQAPGAGVVKLYGAARIYNSGSIAASGDLGAGIATHCYVSDVANRLTGWVFAQKACTLDGGSAPAAVPLPVLVPTPAPVSQPDHQVPEPDAPRSYITQSALPTPVADAQLQSASKNTSGLIAPGVTIACAQYYTVQAGDYCYAIAQKFNTSLDKLRELNQNLDAKCSNLWKGYEYCVKGL